MSKKIKQEILEKITCNGDKMYLCHGIAEGGNTSKTLAKIFESGKLEPSKKTKNENYEKKFDSIFMTCLPEKMFEFNYRCEFIIDPDEIFISKEFGTAPTWSWGKKKEYTFYKTKDIEEINTTLCELYNHSISTLPEQKDIFNFFTYYWHQEIMFKGSIPLEKVKFIIFGDTGANSYEENKEILVKFAEKYNIEILVSNPIKILKSWKTLNEYLK